MIHKARLRKHYYKELERSGEAVPEKQEKKQEEKSSFKDRVKLVKERKQQARQDKDESKKERERMIEKKQQDRLKKKERLSSKTRTGQPLMGPRIENLLEKIKKDLN